jgi:chitodextrinase
MSMNLVRCGVGGLASTAVILGSVLAPGVATADTRSPVAPANLHIQNVSFTSVALAWSPSTDDSGWVMYEVEANALPRSLLRYGSTEPNKTVTGLTSGLTYTLSVVAVDGAGNRSAPTSLQATTPVDRTPPTTPTRLRVATVNGVADSILWDASTDSSNVRYVLRANGNRIFGTTGTMVTAIELLYLDCVVQPGSTYTLTVEALDANNNVSDRSVPVTATFPELS